MMESTAHTLGLDAGAGSLQTLSTPFDDLAAVHAEHEARVYRFLLFSLRDAHAAASITQDTFLTVWRTRATFRGECSPATWLMRIAVRLLQNHVRGNKFRFWLQVRSSAVDPDEIADMLSSGEPTVEADLVAKQRLSGVFRVVSDLPAQQRTAFLLRFNEDLELPEIAATMNLSLSAAKTHLYRALDRVRTECNAAASSKEPR